MKNKTIIPHSIKLLFLLLLSFFLFFLAIKYNFFIFKNSEIFDHILGKNYNNNISSRIIRIIAMIATISALSLGGLLMQIVTRNNLASPGIMGIVSSSNFAVTIATFAIPISSLLGRYFLIMLFASIPLIIITLIIRTKKGINPTTVALIGITLGLMFSSLDWILLYWANSDGQFVQEFINSAFEGINIEFIKFLVPPIASGILLSIIMSKKFDIYKTGDKVAKSLGSNVKLTKYLSYLIILVMIPAALILGGNILFIGVVVPHISRFLMKTEKTIILILSSIFIGIVAILLTAIIDSFIGFNILNILSMVAAPIFIYLAARTRNV